MVAASGDVDEGDVDVEEEGNGDEVDDGKILCRRGAGWLAKRGWWGCDSSAPGRPFNRITIGEKNKRCAYFLRGRPYNTHKHPKG